MCYFVVIGCVFSLTTALVPEISIAGNQEVVTHTENFIPFDDALQFKSTSQPNVEQSADTDKESVRHIDGHFDIIDPNPTIHQQALADRKRVRNNKRHKGNSSDSSDSSSANTIASSYWHKNSYDVVNPPSTT